MGQVLERYGSEWCNGTKDLAGDRNEADAGTRSASARACRANRLPRAGGAGPPAFVYETVYPLWITLRLIELPFHDGLLVIENSQEQSCQTMKLKRAITAIALVSAFAVPVAAGTFEYAVDAYARGDYAKALRLIRPLANDGNATAQFNLGVMDLTGQGAADYSSGALWFREARARLRAGPIQSRGPASRRPRRGADHTEAVLCFRKAADEGGRRRVSP